VEFEADAPADMANQQTLSFGGGAASKGECIESSGTGRHSFFRLRRVARVAVL
jgi:hypothetical protein